MYLLAQVGEDLELFHLGVQGLLDLLGRQHDVVDVGRLPLARGGVGLDEFSLRNIELLLNSCNGKRILSGTGQRQRRLILTVALCLVGVLAAPNELADGSGGTRLRLRQLGGLLLLCGLVALLLRGRLSRLRLLVLASQQAADSRRRARGRFLGLGLVLLLDLRGDVRRSARVYYPISVTFALILEGWTCQWHVMMSRHQHSRETYSCNCFSRAATSACAASSSLRTTASRSCTADAISLPSCWKLLFSAAKSEAWSKLMLWSFWPEI